MPPTIGELGIDTLSAEDRFALVQALWDSVNKDLKDRPISPTIRAELERRVALADADPSRGVPWEVVRAAFRPKDTVPMRKPTKKRS